MWDPPRSEDQNGDIRGYNISYNISASEDEIYFIVGTSIDLTGLQKFTFYNVSVQAFTVGSGPVVSTVIQTDSDGKLVYGPFLGKQYTLNIYEQYMHTNSVNSILCISLGPRPNQPQHGSLDKQSGNETNSAYTNSVNSILCNDHPLLFTPPPSPAPLLPFHSSTPPLPLLHSSPSTPPPLPPPASLLPLPLLHSPTISVPSAPLDLSYRNITPNSINVTWSPPANPNGIIDNYTLQYMAVTMGTVTMGNITVITEITRQLQLLDDLIPFRRYEVMVFALTDKGAGPVSVTLDVFTLEDGKTD